MNHSSRLVPLLLLATGAAGQSWPMPLLDAPLVHLGGNGAAMIEMIDHWGTGQKRPLAIRLQTDYVALYIVGPQVAQLIHGGYLPTSGTWVPFSAVGQIGAPDAAEEAVIGVGTTVFVMRGGAVTTWSVPGVVIAAAIGDFDGDGFGDIATLMAGPFALTLRVDRGSGGSSFVTVDTPLPTTAGPLLLAGEVTGDTTPDLVVVGNRVQTWSWNGVGFASVHDFPVNMPNPKPVAGDIDGDTDVDLVVFGDASYVVLRRTGATSFVVETAVSGGPATHLFDVDSDGDLDGACCSGGGSPVLGINNPTTFQVSINNNGVFAPTYSLPGVGGWHLAGVHDLDGNGFKDLIAGRTIYFARHSLATAPLAANPVALFGNTRVGDHDGDGDADVATTPGVLHRNRGDGQLTPSPVQLLQAPPPGVTYTEPLIPGDFDGDGSEDLIVEERTNGVPTGSRLLVQRGSAYADGGQPFPPGVALSPTLGLEPMPCVRADLDADGDLDLALASTGPAYWSMLWYNNGAGSFTAVPELAFVVVACAELTGDGRPDLLVSDGRLLLQRGLAAGGFAPAEPLTSAGKFVLPTSFRPFEDSVVIADFTNDGLLDVVAGDRYTGTGATQIHFLLNSGTASPPFWAAGYLPTLVSVATLPTRIVLGDVNRDGKTDVVVGRTQNAWDGSKVLLGTANTFVYDQYSTQDLMCTVEALADLDGDGDADALGSHIAWGRTIDGANAPRRSQFGSGSPGVGGVVPQVGTAGPAAVGKVLPLRVAGLMGSTVGILALGSTTWNVPLFGGTSYVSPDVTVLLSANGAAGAAGDGVATLTLPPLQATLAGFEFHLQGAFLDLAANLVLTNGLTLRVGS